MGGGSWHESKFCTLNDLKKCSLIHLFPLLNPIILNEYHLVTNKGHLRQKERFVSISRIIKKKKISERKIFDRYTFNFKTCKYYL